jgi:hypothetical protein
MRIVSFDVGIKNLAYCIMENSTNNNVNDNVNDNENNNKLFKIIKWDVINLCGQEMNCNCLIIDKVKKSKKNIIKKENVEKTCNKKAMYSKDLNYYCKVHVKNQTDYIIPTTKLCNKKFKTMKLVELQELCINYNITYPVGSKKEVIVSSVIAYMQNKFLDTIGKQSANAMTMIDIGIAIRKELDKIPSMLEADYIIIENQISPIANRMKTIQGMIAQYFIMNNKTNIAFISSANKLKAFAKPVEDNIIVEENTKTKTKTKTTYAERKKASVDIMLNFLENDINKEFKDFFTTHKKKDDLADCFLQGVWYLSKSNSV